MRLPLFSGVCAETCSRTVLATRATFHVPAGGSLSLSCLVQHCGDPWKGYWMWTNSTDVRSRAVEESVRHRLTSVTLSANESQLILSFPSVNQSDEGFYGCIVFWGQYDMEHGHFMYVNITAGM